MLILFSWCVLLFYWVFFCLVFYSNCYFILQISLYFCLYFGDISGAATYLPLYCCVTWEFLPRINKEHLSLYHQVPFPNKWSIIQNKALINDQTISNTVMITDSIYHTDRLANRQASQQLSRQLIQVRYPNMKVSPPCRGSAPAQCAPND